jgi:hypothetical protein
MTVNTEACIQAAVTEELRIGDARSAIYRQGLVDVLRLRLQRIPIPARYRPGTVEYDAYFSGNDRGHVLWHKMRDTGKRGARA